MFLFDPAVGIRLSCGVCQQSLSERDARLVYRTDIANRCVLGHDTCLGPDSDVLKGLWTETELAAMLQGEALPVVPFVVLKIVYSDFQFEIDRRQGQMKGGV